MLRLGTDKAEVSDSFSPVSAESSLELSILLALFYMRHKNTIEHPTPGADVLPFKWYWWMRGK